MRKHAMSAHLMYNYNANTVLFDGIQLYKEEFGYLYTYDDRGNITQVRDLQGGTTRYTYDTATNNLMKVEYPDNTTTTYTYDAYHNVETATSSEGVAYAYGYDAYGNNISVSVGSGDSVLTSTATYTSNGNRLEKTTDTAGNVTTYSYNADTNVLEWVQYPENAETQKTTYTYDDMYRMTGSSTAVSTGTNLSATYTYANDRLTKLQTGSTAYTFGYTDFGLRANIQIGSRTLASYTYEEQNHALKRLDYGNGDSVQYTYDDLGRVISQTYEDGDTITYAYDNNGALATVTDSATGRTTTYRYDTTGRLTCYQETNGSSYDHSVAYTYNNRNLLTALKETIDGTARTTTYAYDDDYRITSVATGNNTWSHSYDSSGRTSGIVLRVAGSALLSRTYAYQANASSSSALISTLTQTAENFGLTLNYTYDDNGNIQTVSDGTNTTRYTYDSANQLLREDNQAAGKTWVWTYDNAGNILSKTEYAYTTETVGTAVDTIAYTYGDSDWGDLLTAYDGTAISYDTNGNPLSDGTWTYTWEHGRQLASMSSGNTDLTYTYNADGLRTSKVKQTVTDLVTSRQVNTVTHDYVYSGGLLVQETVTSTIKTYSLGSGPIIAVSYALEEISSSTTTRTLYFTYDASGNPASVSYTDNSGTKTEYYYVINLQGDVVAIVDGTGTTVVEYTYDAWGKPLSTTGTLSSSLGIYNPLRYRGYVYDRDTGLYYLQSRYYNPETGRFINADVVYDYDAGLQGFNLFIYCGNNPINRIDISGADSDGIADGEDMLDEALLKDGGAAGGGNRSSGNSSGGWSGGKGGNGYQNGNNGGSRSSAGGTTNNSGSAHNLPVNNSSMTTDELIDYMLDFLGTGYTEESPGRFVSADRIAQIRMGNDDLLGTHAGGSHVNFNLLVPKYKNVHVYILD